MYATTLACIRERGGAAAASLKSLPCRSSAGAYRSDFGLLRFIVIGRKATHRSDTARLQPVHRGHKCQLPQT